VGPGAPIAQLVLNGTIVGGTIVEQGSGVKFQSGTLSGVTYDGTLDLSANSSTVFIASGLTARGVNGSGAGTVNLTGTSDDIYFEGNTTFDNATINLGSASGYSDFIYNYDINGTGSVLTLGPNLTVDVNTSNYVYLTSAGGNHSGEGIVNAGTINVPGTNATLNVTSYAFTNAGTINVASGDSLDIQSQNWSNTGTITIASGAALRRRSSPA